MVHLFLLYAISISCKSRQFVETEVCLYLHGVSSGNGIKGAASFWFFGNVRRWVILKAFTLLSMYVLSPNNGC